MTLDGLWSCQNLKGCCCHCRTIKKCAINTQRDGCNEHKVSLSLSREVNVTPPASTYWQPSAHYKRVATIFPQVCCVPVLHSISVMPLTLSTTIYLPAPPPPTIFLQSSHELNHVKQHINKLFEFKCNRSRPICQFWLHGRYYYKQQYRWHCAA